MVRAENEFTNSVTLEEIKNDEFFAFALHPRLPQESKPNRYLIKTLVNTKVKVI